ncbi:MAG: phosphonate C-P lyase system protein PhnH [Acetobacteraceae bacterium]|nr:phosphonate C-P lyase system protein PhnH [Acetobacteraceae bacterium]
MSGLSPGFADPVADAQSCFRAVLDAMSRPGRLRRIAGLTPAAPLGHAAAALLMTLVDQETPLWLDPEAAGARAWIEFHCGAPLVEDAGAAMFAFALARPGLPMPDLTSLCAGTHESPETAATLILQLPALGSGRRWRLSGPGLRTPEVLQADGLPADFAVRWQHNHGQFPCGVDLILCAGDTLTALPRSVMIEEA